MSVERLLVQKGTERVIGFSDVAIEKVDFTFDKGRNPYISVHLRGGGEFISHFPTNHDLSGTFDNCRTLRFYLDHQTLIGYQLFDDKKKVVFESGPGTGYEFKPVDKK
jgi:hypothetical protein